MRDWQFWILMSVILATDIEIATDAVLAVIALAVSAVVVWQEHKQKDSAP
jgi:hypothetical protein